MHFVLIFVVYVYVKRSSIGQWWWCHFASFWYWPIRQLQSVTSYVTSWTCIGAFIDFVEISQESWKKMFRISFQFSAVFTWSLIENLVHIPKTFFSWISTFHFVWLCYPCPCHQVSTATSTWVVAVWCLVDGGPFFKL